MTCETDSFTVGKAQVHRVEELSLSFPMDMLNVPDALIERHRGWLFPDWFDADGNWTMVVQSWIAIVDGLVIVIDPCVGNSRPLPAFPVFDMLDTPFIERFGATGIRPDEVDAVICTHLHSDHCGWNTTLRDGRFVPTFPNAKYYMARREFDRWDPRRPGHLAVEANAGVFERSVQPVFDAGLVELIPADHRISPSLAVCEAHGHTAVTLPCISPRRGARPGSRAIASITPSNCFTRRSTREPARILRPHWPPGGVSSRRSCPAAR
jgi:hypothetical protein